MRSIMENIVVILTRMPTEMILVNAVHPVYIVHTVPVPTADAWKTVNHFVV